jgi:hypothetical protein
VHVGDLAFGRVRLQDVDQFVRAIAHYYCSLWTGSDWWGWLVW